MKLLIGANDLSVLMRHKATIASSVIGTCQFSAANALVWLGMLYPLYGTTV
jgi:hypothetical protein